jgi:hypothetical protein
LDDRNPDAEREAAIRDRYAVFAKFRDGERNQTATIVDKLIPRAQKKRQNTIYGKWGGGRSMSESMNDKGKGIHPVLHKGYGDPKFKYKAVYPDPPGLQWQQLKVMLKSKLSSGDFKVIWKAIASAPGILSKALTEANLNSAFNSTGAVTYEGYANYQAGRTKDPSDKNIILSSNPHFATDLTTVQGQRVLDCIDHAAEIVNEKDHIPEDDYPALLGDADNCPPMPPTHMDLGLMAVNRQRCCILGEGLFEYRKNKMERAKEQGGKKRARAGADGDNAQPRAKKRKTCSNPACLVEEGDGCTGWVKCKTKNCRKWFCPACNGSKDSHYTKCQEVWKKKEEQKTNK